jgi:hypothetical protein
VDRIIGRAWESSDETGGKKINTAIGFPFAANAWAMRIGSTYSTQEKLRTLKTENEQIRAKFESTIDERAKLIEQLKKRVQALM